jgi:hypothetical protein
LHFLSGKRFKSGDHNISVRINGEEVKFDERNTLRWLGVDFDSKLSMRSFVSNKCRICFAILRMLRRIRPFINHQSAALLANSLILSRIDYCSSLINNVDKEMVKKLQRVLNLTGRMVDKTKRETRSTEVMKKMGWLPVEYRVEEKIAKFVFEVLQGNSPLSDCCALTIYQPNRPLRSTHSENVTLVLGSASKKIGLGSLNVAGPRIWNALANDCRTYHLSRSIFYNRLRECFTSLAFRL